MRVTTPDSIEAAIFDGDLVLSLPPTKRETPTAITSKDMQAWESSRVIIGEPRCWSVTDYFEIGDLPYIIRTKLKQSDFFVVRLACSFRPGRNTYAEWARFEVELLPDDPNLSPPLAFDMHPQEVRDEKKLNYKIEIAPTLKFKDHLEGSLGKASMEFEYRELIPAITAVGVETNQFSWDLAKTPQHPLDGIRWFHVIVDKPKDVKVMRAKFDVVADVITPQGRLKAGLRNQASMQLERVICT